MPRRYIGMIDGVRQMDGDGRRGARVFRTGALLLIAALLSGCATIGEPLPPAPTLAEIVSMSKEGVSAKEIIERMQRARAVYRLPASELAKLRDAGVADEVIDHMQRTHLDAVRREQALRAPPPMWGPWGPWAAPHRWHGFDPWWPHRDPFWWHHPRWPHRDPFWPHRWW
jgi:hypothetical protein